jgi:integrase
MATRKNGTKFLADFMVKNTRYRKQFDSEIEAKEYETNVRAKLHRGERVDKDDKRLEPITLSQMFTKVVLNVWQGKANEPTALQHISMIERFFGAKKLAHTIDINDFDRFKLHCKELGNSPATIRLKFATISKAFSFAASRGWIPKKPLMPELDKVNNQREAFFSDEEEADILEYLEEIGEDYFADFFMWQIDTGMRPSEARRVHSSQIYSDQQLGYVVDLKETKNNEPRKIPLTRRAYIAFRNHHKKGNMWEHWTKERIRTVWDKVKRSLGREKDRDFIFYLCRHTCGSRLVQRTGNIALTKKWLGHKRIEQTLRYAHLNSNSLLSGLKALEYGALCSDNKVTNLSAFTDKTNNYKKGVKAS